MDVSNESMASSPKYLRHSHVKIIDPQKVEIIGPQKVEIIGPQKDFVGTYGFDMGMSVNSHAYMCYGS